MLWSFAFLDLLINSLARAFSSERSASNGCFLLYRGALHELNVELLLVVDLLRHLLELLHLLLEVVSERVQFVPLLDLRRSMNRFYVELFGLKTEVAELFDLRFCVFHDLLRTGQRFSTILIIISVHSYSEFFIIIGRSNLFHL